MFDNTQNYAFFHYNILHEPSIITILINTNEVHENVTNDIKRKRNNIIKKEKKYITIIFTISNIAFFLTIMTT
jgi:hypothetical protein